MRTLLVFAQQPGLPAALRAVLDPERYRVLWQSDAGAGQLLLSPGLVDACILDADLTDIEPIRTVERLHRLLPACPILIYAAVKQWEWEEEAYLLGVQQVLTKPVRSRLLHTHLERLWEAQHRTLPPAAAPPLPAEVGAPDPARHPPEALEVMREFSRILTHSLCSEALLKQFLHLLREVLGVNRSAIFLRFVPSAPPASAGFPGDTGVPVAAPPGRLRVACSQGINPGLLDRFELSLESGIGAYTHRQGRILKRQSPAALADREIQQEFDLLGTQVAIPVLDRERLLGIALFDDRLTGEPFTSEELGLTFHLLEELGLAIRNISLHDQLAAGHQMMSAVLGQLDGGCVVVGRDLDLLHVNRAAHACLARPDRPAAPLEFRDLPQALASRLFEVLKTGTPVPPFKYRWPHRPNATFRVRITPFCQPGAATANAALLLVEDISELERSHQLEVEAANLRLAKVIAEHLAHEIGNSLVPISTYQQLLSKKYSDPEFRENMTQAMEEGVKRISRLTNQMLFMARDSAQRDQRISIRQMIEEAFGEAKINQPASQAQLHLDDGHDLACLGNAKELKHAFSEVMLNALQANPSDPQVWVRLLADTDGEGCHWVRVEVEDAGSGFSTAAAPKALDPFFTTHTVGLGLGLTVTRKIIETHQGKIEIVQPAHGKRGGVRISLPAADAD
jgi:signal transduction histidine kinase/DNA-binding NarL/FixJ family response regulator